MVAMFFYSVSNLPSCNHLLSFDCFLMFDSVDFFASSFPFGPKSSLIRVLHWWGCWCFLLPNLDLVNSRNDLEEYMTHQVVVACRLEVWCNCHHHQRQLQPRRGRAKVWGLLGWLFWAHQWRESKPAATHLPLPCHVPWNQCQHAALHHPRSGGTNRGRCAWPISLHPILPPPVSGSHHPPAFTPCDGSDLQRGNGRLHLHLRHEVVAPAEPVCPGEAAGRRRQIAKPFDESWFGFAICASWIGSGGGCRRPEPLEC